MTYSLCCNCTFMENIKEVASKAGDEVSKNLFMFIMVLILSLSYGIDHVLH
jgi:hypothetical protein